MKYIYFFIIFTTLLCLASFSQANQQPKISIFYNSINSYFVTADASAMPNDIKSKKYIDPRKQYYDDAKFVTEYDLNLSENPAHWYSDKIPSLKKVQEDFKLSTALSDDYAVISSKMYYRIAGLVPKDQVKVEMNLARKNPTSHMPKTLDALKYFVIGYPIPAGEGIAVKHSFVELCTKNTKDGLFYRFYVDRGSRESIISDLWATRVRVIFLGNTTNCNLEEGVWLNDEVSKTNNISHITLIDQSYINKDVYLSQIIELGKKYMAKFPVYNTLVNCQHFAVNLYNQMTDKAVDYVSNDIMDDHSDASGLQNEYSVKFDLKLEEKKQVEEQKGNKKFLQ